MSGCEDVMSGEGKVHGMEVRGWGVWEQRGDKGWR